MLTGRSAGYVDLFRTIDMRPQLCVRVTATGICVT